MAVTSTKNQSPYGIACVRCDDRLIAPSWSEFVSEGHIRHSWTCESCGHQFETSDRFNAATNPGWQARPLPSLVA